MLALQSKAFVRTTAQEGLFAPSYAMILERCPTNPSSVETADRGQNHKGWEVGPGP